ncbi:MAG: SUMF1/EgtB/PvdO family nonheme iron enzyme [Thermoanaerobaculia bacterium]|nr:SUMF1/EgtB/PvdO family nonheme iron enzyme [Thermoanaerobaculia bacterium]
MPPPYKLFTIYAREDAQYLDELRGHLRPLEHAGRIRVWSDRGINPGVDWEREIVQNIDSADIILILVSAAYFNSAYIHEVEIKRALARHEKGEARVLPVILRPCAFGDDPVISRLQALPADAKPVTSRTHWPERDDAWLDVVAGLKRTLDDLFEAEKRKEEEVRAAAERKRQAEIEEHQRRERDRIAAQQREREEQDRHEEEAEARYRRELLERRIQEEQITKNANARIARRIREGNARKDVNSPPSRMNRYTIYGGVLFLLLAVWLLPKIFTSKEKPADDARPPSSPGSISAPDMVLIKGGTFDMGDTFGEGENNEKPVHRVTLSDFYLGKTEVTFDEYDAYCASTGKSKPSDEGWGRGKRPVITVSWFDAIEYCNWLSEKQNLTKVYKINGDHVAADWNANGYRLPTEAEWEYAARSSGRNEKWAGTPAESDLYRYANFCDKNCEYEWKTAGQNDDYRYTAPVAGFQPNAAGLFDMSGNVWEWCWDRYGSYPSGPQTNPVGLDLGSRRVRRGGSWFKSPADARTACRGYFPPYTLDDDLGFRLARSVKF